MARRFTAADFERWYAANSRTTVERLHYFGRYAEKCHCGDPICTGWAMGHQHDDALFEQSLQGELAER
jgi:Mn-dependent DtxR family transcriptional regulator